MTTNGSLVIDKGPITSSHIVRWCAAQENWHKVHYDERFAREVDGLESVIINGSLKQEFLVQAAEELMPDGGWLWNLRVRFLAADAVGDHLEIWCVARDVRAEEGFELHRMELEIRNRARGVTTIGVAQSLLDRSGTPVIALPRGWRDARPRPPLPSAAEAGDLQSGFGELDAAVGSVIDSAVSAYPIDSSRLRLYCTAIGDMPATYWDPESARTSKYGGLVGPALFPMHSIARWPSDDRLSSDEDADGREAGAREVGVDIAERFSLPFRRLLNGGAEVEVHRRARIGDQVTASSRLVSAVMKAGKSGRFMLVTTESEFSSMDELLLRVWQDIIIR
jgi:hydroxyacyl-ACP dehydratase HTD2-like protein with hotdog domain